MAGKENSMIVAEPWVVDIDRSQWHTFKDYSWETKAVEISWVTQKNLLNLYISSIT